MRQPECRDARARGRPSRLMAWRCVAYLSGSHAAVAAHGMPARGLAPSKSFYSVPGARREAKGGIRAHSSVSVPPHSHPRGCCSCGGRQPSPAERRGVAAPLGVSWGWRRGGDGMDRGSIYR